MMSESHFSSILEDSEDEEIDISVTPDKSSGKFRQDRSELGKELYLIRCNKLGAIPVGKILRTFGSSSLSLANHSLGPLGAKALAAPLQISSTIVDLDLSGCDVQASGLTYLLEGLVDNVYVEHLNLAQNNLGLDGAKCLCHLLLHNTTITTVNVSGNHFGDRASNFVSSIIQKNGSITMLDLANNGLSADTAKLLGPALSTNTSLKTLNLSWNLLRLRDISPIAKCLKSNATLRVLDLSYNGVGFEGAKSMGDALKRNTTLQELNLTGTNIVDKAVYILGKGLQHNTGLQTLHLSHNPLTEDGTCALMQFLVKNQQLATRHIHLQATAISKAFCTLVKHIQVEHPLFTIFHEELTLEKHSHPLSRFYHHMLSEGTTPDDVIGAFDETSQRQLSNEEFCHALKKWRWTTDQADVDQLLEYIQDGENEYINRTRFCNMWNEFTRLNADLVETKAKQRRRNLEENGGEAG